MDTDKQQLVATANEEGVVTVGVVVVRKPSDGDRRIFLRLLCALVTLLTVVPIAVVLGFQYSISGVMEPNNLRYEIKFDSVTEHIIDDPANRLTQYHVVAPEHEVWAVHDFDAGAHVIKVANVEGYTNCYVTSLDAVTDEEYGSPDITYKKVTDVGVVSLEMANNAREEIISFEADITPITDVSMLGKTGQELCHGHASYQMWQYEISSNDLDTEFDPDLPVLRTYTISHRESAATRQELTQPQASLVMIDSTGLRVRRQELEEKEEEEEEEEDEEAPDETPAITAATDSTPEDQPSMLESKVFRLWDYFSRRRPTRTRRALTVYKVKYHRYNVHDRYRPRYTTSVPSRRIRRELPSDVSPTADRTTDDGRSSVADALVPERTRRGLTTILETHGIRVNTEGAVAGVSYAVHDRFRPRPRNVNIQGRKRRDLPSYVSPTAHRTTDDETSRVGDAMATNYRALDRFRRRRQRRSSSAAARVRRQVDNREWPRQVVRELPQQHQSPPVETADQESGSSVRVAKNYNAWSLFRQRSRG